MIMNMIYGQITLSRTLASNSWTVDIVLATTKFMRRPSWSLPREPFPQKSAHNPIFPGVDWPGNSFRPDNDHLTTTTTATSVAMVI